ncbi:unnamed protein product [Blepharisma stoltei]|uniref:Uncharacterized protein n=1 Tax=Blepharisma stoltei TaxID=1481888 RepID=A0AAU9JKA7_9CILI|nr:unnamed protein product [Blepharisma stoltei]
MPIVSIKNIKVEIILIRDLIILHLPLVYFSVFLACCAWPTQKMKPAVYAKSASNYIFIPNFASIHSSTYTA